MRPLSTGQEPGRFWENASRSRGITVTWLSVSEDRELGQLPLQEVLYLQGPVTLPSSFFLSPGLCILNPASCFMSPVL